MPRFPHTMNPQDLQFHQRLWGRIDQADLAITQAHAALSRANVAHAAAHNGMAVWMEELAERYGMKPDDVVDRDGKLHFVDPAWREILNQEAAKRGDWEEPPEEGRPVEDLVTVEPVVVTSEDAEAVKRLELL